MLLFIEMTKDEIIGLMHSEILSGENNRVV